MIEEHYRHVKDVIGEDIQLCVVTKKRSINEIRSYYDAGERVFGENHAQELLEKVKLLPDDICWQFIGHLQRNKVKEILPYTECIQSLDSLKLAAVIDREAQRLGKIQNVLVEFHMAEMDQNKTGLDPKDAYTFMNEVLKYPHIHVQGIMAMGPHTEDKETIRIIFDKTHVLYENLQKKYGKEHMHILSMGMSADYEIAVQCGSSMVRIGTYLFE